MKVFLCVLTFVMATSAARAADDAAVAKQLEKLGFFLERDAKGFVSAASCPSKKMRPADLTPLGRVD